MAPNHFFQNLKRTIRGSHHCPGCPQLFRSRGGLTKHLNSAHPYLLDDYTHEHSSGSSDKASSVSGSSPDQSNLLSEGPIHSLLSPAPSALPNHSSPEPSNASKNHNRYRSPSPGSPLQEFMGMDINLDGDYPGNIDDPPSPIPSSRSNMDIDLGIDRDISPILSSRSNSPPSPVPSHRDDVRQNRQNGKPKRASEPIYTRVYHRGLNGMICDEHGNEIPPDSPPPPRTDPHHGPDEWFPYNCRMQFELADFLYRRNQMSEGHTDFLLGLINALLATHNDTAPFRNHDDMHAKIDATTLGEAPWNSFSLSYNGPVPDGMSWENIPTWMTEDHEVWYRDPITLVENLLSNPDFKDEFDYTPYQEYDEDGSHRFRDFMSGNWAWQQADTIIEDHPDTIGSFLVTIIIGSDKTTVSVATGHTSYWPIYLSIGNIHNNVRRGHRNGVVLLGFLAIPKTDNESRNDLNYRRFRRQLLHSSLYKILESLRPNMTSPRVVRCPDGHYRRVIFSLGPYIADYPEQCLLASVVQGWCPRCTAPSDDIDSGRFIHRSEAHTELLSETCQLKELWDEYGIVGNVKPFTTYFLRADIHEMLSPDILHQLIKGSFKDHIVTWVNDYIKAEYPDKQAKKIMDDIDLRISLAPAFTGLRRFPQGRGFVQWTGDDSKALMKVYLPAIEGYVPDEMVKALQAFLDFCYIARRDTHDTHSLKALDNALDRFHTHREIFQTSGVRPKGFNLPRSHAAIHYARLIRAFGAPNGLCSSITESKHIEVVKEPWRRSSRWEAIKQMLITNARLNKLAAARVDFTSRGMLEGTALAAVLRLIGLTSSGDDPPPPEVMPAPNTVQNPPDDDNDDNDGVDDSRVIESRVELSKTPLKSVYPEDIDEPDLTHLIQEFIHTQHGTHSDSNSHDIDNRPAFYEKITIHTAAIATFHAPSDLSGISGMKRERIHAVEHWRKGPGRYDTLLVNTSSSIPNDSSTNGILDLEVVRAHLFFSFTLDEVKYPCALVHWFSRKSNIPSDITGMYVVEPDFHPDGQPVTSVVHLDTVFRATHLLPVFRNHPPLKKRQRHEQTLDLFSKFYVNRYIDHHAFEVIV